MKPQFAIGVFGIIFDGQNRVLLCHRRDYDLWNLPGGTLEVGESPQSAIAREILEETGLEIGVPRLIGIYDKPDQGELAFSFVCKITGGRATLNEEADNIRYFKVNKLPSNISPKQAERIRDAFEDRNGVIFKTQTGQSSIELIREGKL